MLFVYSSDVVIWLHEVLICVKPHKLTNYTFEKKNFFLVFFVNFLCCTSPNSKKSICSENLKVLPIWNRWHLFDLSIFLDFVAIFEKKTWPKKNFFFDFWKSPFLSIIRRDLTKKNFWKFQKKNFQKKFFFSNV